MVELGKPGVLFLLLAWNCSNGQASEVDDEDGIIWDKFRTVLSGRGNDDTFADGTADGESESANGVREEGVMEKARDLGDIVLDKVIAQNRAVAALRKNAKTADDGSEDTAG
jgi:hypothetical protein